jgi:hypothetical protein
MTMAKLTKKQRSAAGRKAAKTREKNKARRSRSAKKGAAHRKGGKRKWGSPKQRAALKKMQAARGTGRRSSTRRSSGKRSSDGSIAAQVANLKRRTTALEQVTTRVVLPAVAHVYREAGMRMPQIAGPRYAQLGAGR